MCLNLNFYILVLHFLHSWNCLMNLDRMNFDNLKHHYMSIYRKISYWCWTNIFWLMLKITFIISFQLEFIICMKTCTILMILTLKVILVLYLLEYAQLSAIFSWLFYIFPLISSFCDIYIDHEKYLITIHYQQQGYQYSHFNLNQNY